jgi:hypothetical protein
MKRLSIPDDTREARNEFRKGVHNLRAGVLLVEGKDSEDNDKDGEYNAEPKLK